MSAIKYAVDVVQTNRSKTSNDCVQWLNIDQTVMNAECSSNEACLAADA